MRQVIIHPFNFYHDIQEPRRIRWIDGLVIVAIVYLARMVSILLTGYAFRNTGALRNLVFARDRLDGSTMVDLEHLELGRQRHP